MRKLNLVLLLVMLVTISNVQAQSNEVTGMVTDDKGGPIAGVSIKVKSSNTGTTTGNDGRFKIPAKQKDILLVSYVGYEAKEISVNGIVLNIQLLPDTKALNEVVVTGLGIRREKKALGYAVSTIGKKDLELRPEGDLGRVLSGKAPGVDILGTSGISGSGTNIVIRGVSTITGGSVPPLFIVDGVPFDGSTNAQSNFTFGNQTSSRFLDLDPNNIESINVLKGLSATIQYGDLARNGVIVITTKNGSGASKLNKKFEISLAQSFFFNDVASLPNYQDDYGAGFNLLPSFAFSNWGAKFTTPSLFINHPYDRADLRAAFPQFTGAQYEYKAYDNVKKFFQRGVVSNTSINFSGGSGNTRINGSYSYTDDEGFLKNNFVRKNNFGIGGSSKLSNKFSVSGVLNYAITDFQSPTTSTSFGSSATNPGIYGDLIYTPRSIDLAGLPYKNPVDGSSVYYRANNGITNPLWAAENQLAKQKVDRVFGNLELKYEFTKGLSAFYRIGLDNTNDLNQIRVNKGAGSGTPLQYLAGMLRTVNATNRIVDHNFVVNYQKIIGKDWNLNADAGINLRDDTYSQTGIKSTGQLVFGLFNHSNFTNHEAVNEDNNIMDFSSKVKRLGLFINSTIAFREFLYFTAGARQSWISTLEKNNRGILYPSVALSYIPTTHIEALRNSNYVSYLKLRVSSASSARFSDPYQTRAALNILTNAFVTKEGKVINNNSIPNLYPNPDLKPELLQEYEAGLEAKLLKNRIGIDLTYFIRTSKNQILQRNLDPGTGYTATSINAGDVVNKGIELALGFAPVKTKKVTWQIDINYTRLRNEVKNLPDDIKEVNFAGFSTIGNYAVNGRPLGILKGFGPKIDLKSGKFVVGSDGQYIQDNQIREIANPLPNYRSSLINTITWQDFSFRMQWDYTNGGQMYAQTPGTLLARGLTNDTKFDRTQPVILPGVKADGSPNDILISPTAAYFNTYIGNPGYFNVWDATLIRLRELSLSYSLPAAALRKLPFGRVAFTISGQNLWYRAPNFPRHTNFDPETSSLGVGTGRGIELLTGPSSRRFGASLQITF
jgi:TonB-linked SusC/RagA family outer membrane protein